MKTFTLKAVNKQHPMSNACADYVGEGVEFGDGSCAIAYHHPRQSPEDAPEHDVWMSRDRMLVALGEIFGRKVLAIYPDASALPTEQAATAAAEEASGLSLTDVVYQLDMALRQVEGAVSTLQQQGDKDAHDTARYGRKIAELHQAVLATQSVLDLHHRDIPNFVNSLSARIGALEKKVETIQQTPVATPSATLTRVGNLEEVVDNLQQQVDHCVHQIRLEETNRGLSQAAAEYCATYSIPLPPAVDVSRAELIAAKCGALFKALIKQNIPSDTANELVRVYHSEQLVLLERSWGDYYIKPKVA